jgi:FkbM family methyltransferase
MILNRLMLSYYKHGWRGFGRLWNVYIRLTGAKHLTTTTRYGSRFNLSPKDYVDSFVLREGYYESEVLEALLRFTEPGSVVWDIGAAFGLHGITIKVLHPSMRVVCFEPNPRMTAKIKENARLNNADVQVVPFALSSASGRANLYTVDGNSGMGTLTPFDGFNYSAPIPCETTTGNDIVAHDSSLLPNVVKIDIEGAEIEALKGMSRILESSKLRAMVFEDSPVERKVAGALSHYGFKAEKLNRLEHTEHPLENFLAYR